MAFYCKDCTHRGVRAIRGQCPACGSYNIEQRTFFVREPEKSPPKWRLPLLIVLWAYLIVTVSWKLLS